ncbi:ferritin-like-domain-containing protein [Mycena epipterygia]|nr:ferritin-like-domain-containing protein [Mycena epipterygia]
MEFENPPITTLESLKRHLHFAMAIELSTIPLYLYAMYSIKLPANKVKDPRFWDPVTGAIRGIVAEEMLHLSLAGNVLKAIGGVPKLYSQKYDDVKIFPTYGMEMPGRVPKLEMNLRKATKANFDTFLGIELPQGRNDPPGGADEYHTLGQFYEALKDGLKYLGDQMGEKLFHQDSLPYQFAPGTGYQPRIQNAGGSIVVKDLKTALDALDVIVEQGEGRDNEEFVGDELAHYYIFQGLKNGTQDWEVYNVPENPTTQTYAKPSLKQIYQVSRTFDAAYCYLLLSIEKLWTIRDEDERRKLVLANMYSLMIGVLAPLAKLLVTQPLNDGTDRVAAPCFSWYDFSAGQGTPFKQLRAEMKTTILSYVQVTVETDDQVVEHDFGGQIETLIPIQTALDNMLDIDTFEQPTGKVSKKGLNVVHTQGFKGFA